MCSRLPNKYGMSDINKKVQDPMMPETLPIEELRKLLAGVSNHGQQHLLEAESDLMQTTFLLGEAIEKLGASFMAIHEAVSEQQAALNLISGDVSINANLLACRERIAQEVNNAVTGLQFQDLTNQLIARTLKRIGGLKDLLSTLAEHGNAMGAGDEHDEIMRLLQEMNQNLNSQSVALEGGLRKSVDQQHMASGEIELF